MMRGSIVLLLFLVLLVPTALGHDTMPGVISPFTIPRLEWQNGSTCSAVVLGDRLVTAAHCIGPKVSVVYGIERRPIEGVACTSPESDFAVLRTPIPLGLPRITIGDLPPVGDRVWIAGWPKGQWEVGSVNVRSVMQVVVLGTKPLRRLPAIGGVASKTLAQGGISGGGMFDTTGRLVGLVCCKNESEAFVAAVPIKYGLWYCPQTGR